MDARSRNGDQAIVPGIADMRRDVWNAKIAVRLCLAEEDVSATGKPPPLCFHIPRMGYLPWMISTATKLLASYLPPGELTPWFSYKYLPLRWDVPAGVLYDILVNDESTFPWDITFHVHSYPVQSIPPFSEESSLRGSLLNSLKEASHVARGSCSRVMELSHSAEQSLMLGACAGDEARVRSVLSSALLAAAPAEAQVPVRFWVRQSAGLSDPSVAEWRQLVFTSRGLLRRGGPEEGFLTLREAVAAALSRVLGLLGGGAAPAALQALGSGGVDPAASVLTEAPRRSGAEDEAAAKAIERGGSAAEEVAEREPRAGDAPKALPDADAQARLGSGPTEEALRGEVDAESARAEEAAESARAEGAAQSTQAEGAAQNVRGEEARASTSGNPAAQESPAPSPRLESSMARHEAAPVPLPSLPASNPELPSGLVRRVIVGGIAPPLDCPIGALHAAMHAADYFLYVTVIVDAGAWSGASA